MSTEQYLVDIGYIVSIFDEYSVNSTHSVDCQADWPSLVRTYASIAPAPPLAIRSARFAVTHQPNSTHSWALFHPNSLVACQHSPG